MPHAITQIQTELDSLGYITCVFDGPNGKVVSFGYTIETGSHKGEPVKIGVSFQESNYPEYPPHWVHITPPINDGRGGSVQSYESSRRTTVAGNEQTPRSDVGPVAHQAHVGVHQRTSKENLDERMRFEATLTAEANAVSGEHLLQHFSRGEAQEDLCFALWRPSTGSRRRTALINEILLPLGGERNLHGNASFNPDYLARAVKCAMARDAGLAFMHSHPGTGWQGMSPSDVAAERDVIAYPAGATGLPLVGLTIGSDGYWSSRFWERENGHMQRRWCQKTRVVGPKSYKFYFNDEIAHPAPRRDILRRTFDSWGTESQNTISRLRVGIVGLGSVGGIVAEALARIGVFPGNPDRPRPCRGTQSRQAALRDCARHRKTQGGLGRRDHEGPCHGGEHRNNPIVSFHPRNQSIRSRPGL